MGRLPLQQHNNASNWSKRADGGKGSDNFVSQQPYWQVGLNQGSWLEFHYNTFTQNKELQDVSYVESIWRNPTKTGAADPGYKFVAPTDLENRHIETNNRATPWF